MDSTIQHFQHRLSSRANVDFPRRGRIHRISTVNSIIDYRCNSLYTSLSLFLGFLEKQYRRSIASKVNRKSRLADHALTPQENLQSVAKIQRFYKWGEGDCVFILDTNARWLGREGISNLLSARLTHLTIRRHMKGGMCVYREKPIVRTGITYMCSLISGYWGRNGISSHVKRNVWMAKW